MCERIHFSILENCSHFEMVILSQGKLRFGEYERILLSERNFLVSFAQGKILNELFT